MSGDKLAIYPGTFDPMTNGHLDVIERASRLFDRIIVAIAINSRKKPMFTERERIEMIRDAVKPFPNVEIEVCRGLLVEFAVQRKATALVRGLRAVTDFEYEFQIALMNRKLEPEISTVFLMPHEKYTFLSSTIVREVARFQRDISDLVPASVARKLREKFPAPPEA